MFKRKCIKRYFLVKKGKKGARTAILFLTQDHHKMIKCLCCYKDKSLSCNRTNRFEGMRLVKMTWFGKFIYLVSQSVGDNTGYL